MVWGETTEELLINALWAAVEPAASGGRAYLSHSFLYDFGG